MGLRLDFPSLASWLKELFVNVSVKIQEIFKADWMSARPLESRRLGVGVSGVTS